MYVDSSHCDESEMLPSKETVVGTGAMQTKDRQKIKLQIFLQSFHGL